MFLSNRQAATLAFSLMLFTAAGCSWFPGTGSPASNVTAVTPPDRGIPFETKEPDTYQADFYTVADGIESRSHFARDRSSWRFDSYDGDRPSRSIIRGEKLSYLDHSRKVFSEPPTNGPDARPAFVEELTTSLLRPKRPAAFEKLGTEGNVDKYSVKTEGTRAPSTIFYDTSKKMIVRQEFEGGFAFEMRNFTLEVDDGSFRVPAGYRKIVWQEYKSL